MHELSWVGRLRAYLVDSIAEFHIFPYLFESFKGWCSRLNNLFNLVGSFKPIHKPLEM